MQLRIWFTVFAAKGHCRLIFYLLSTSIPRFFSAKLFSSWTSSIYWCLGLLFLRSGLCTSPLLSQSISPPCWDPSGWHHNSLGVSTTPPSSVSSADLLRVYSAPLYRSSIRMLDDKWRQHWSLVYTTADLQLDFISLIATLLSLAVQPVFSSPHCQLIYLIFHQLLHDDLTGDSIKGLSEVQLDNLHCSSLIYQISHFIVEDHRFGQKRLSPHESMLNTPCLPWELFPDYLLHHLSRDWGEADLPVVPCTLLVFFKIGVTFVFF